jgi:ubiquinone/menaquinone biosynthesis C-methylase UbiE
MKTLESREGYDLYAPNYRKDHAHLDSFDWEITRKFLMDRIQFLLDSRPGRIRLLDLGCGDGRVLKRLLRSFEQKSWTERIELHGWDISEGMLKQARKALGPGVQLQRCDLQDVDSIPPNQGFDLIVSCFVLVHIDPVRDFTDLIAQLLAPGGRAVFNNIPQHQALVLEAGGQKFQIDYHHHKDDTVAQATTESGLLSSHQESTAWSTIFLVDKA